MSENGLRMIMFSVLTYGFFSIGAVRGGSEGEGWRRRKREEFKRSQCGVCVCANLEFHVSIGLLRAELHLFLELLQCHVCLLNLLPLALPGSVQLALHLPLNQTHTEMDI